VAPISSGDTESLNNLRTGAALVTAHGPSIQNAQEKQVIWERNEMRFWFAAAMFDSKIRNQNFENRFPDLNIEVRFPNDFVPGEELVRSEIDSMSLNSHTTTIRDILRRKYPTATEERITDLRKEVLDDSSALTDSKRVFVSEKSEGEGAPIKSSNTKSLEQQKM
jgi:hypothetical protein